MVSRRIQTATFVCLMMMLPSGYAQATRLVTADGRVVVEGDDVFLLPTAVVGFEPAGPDDGIKPLVRFPEDLLSPFGDGRTTQVWIRDDEHPQASITVDFGRRIAAGELLLRVWHGRKLYVYAEAGTDLAKLDWRADFPASEGHPHRGDWSRLPFDRPIRYVRLVFWTPEGALAKGRARRAEYLESFGIPLEYPELRSEEEKPVLNGPGRIGDSAWWLDTLMVKTGADSISDEDWRAILAGETASAVHVSAATVPDAVNHAEQARLAEFHRLSSERGKSKAAAFAFVDSMSLVTHVGDIPTDAMGRPGQLSLAANEAESIQLVVAAKEKLEGVRIRAGPLWGPNGHVIRGDDIECGVIRSVMCKVDPTLPLCPDWIQRGSCDLEPGQIQQFWITVKADKSIPPGVYRGNVSLGAYKPTGAANKGVLSAPLTVRVWGFALPDRPTMKSVLQHPGDPDLMLSHRYSPGWVISPRGFLEPDGSFTLDFVEYDRLMLDLRQRGLNSFPIAPFDGRHPAFSFFVRQTGEPHKELPLNPAGGRFGQYMKTVADHLREQGWLDDAYFYIWDEPDERWYGQIGLLGKYCREAAPDLKTLVTAHPCPALDPAIDIYVPRTRAWLRSTMHRVVQAARKRGKTVWWYEASNSHPAPGIMPIGYQPSITRIQFWLNWKYEIPGTLYWGADWFKNPPSYPGVYGWGDGMLYYPDHGPSVRLEMIRDGIEDYEYFSILDRLTRDQPHHPARKLLTIPEDIVQEVARYTTDPRLLRTYRRKLAEAIEALSTSD